jgi:hypothetical protein
MDGLVWMAFLVDWLQITTSWEILPFTSPVVGIHGGMVPGERDVFLYVVSIA